MGKGMKWDGPVVKILRGLGKLLKRRQEVFDQLKLTRTQFVKSRQGLAFMQSKSSSELLDIIASIDWDWSTEAGKLLDEHYGSKLIS